MLFLHKKIKTLVWKSLSQELTENNCPERLVRTPKGHVKGCVLDSCSSTERRERAFLCASLANGIAPRGAAGSQPRSHFSCQLCALDTSEKETEGRRGHRGHSRSPFRVVQRDRRAGGGMMCGALQLLLTLARRPGVSPLPLESLP